MIRVEIKAKKAHINAIKLYKEQKKQERQVQKLRRDEAKRVYKLGVEDRKAEVSRKRSIRELQKTKQPIPKLLTHPIIDREKE
jgi:2-phosphoglycerate kinase